MTQSSRPAELPVDLGSKLFNEFFAALLRADDAAKRVHAAQTAGDVNARERAMMDREIAIGEVQRIKEKAVADLFLMLRFADELRPGGLRQYLDPAYRLELDVTQDAIREIEDRLDAGGSAGD